MSKGSFEKVSHSDTALYGRPKLLLCGFAANAQPKFRAVMEMAGLGKTSVVWVTEALCEERLTTLIEFSENTGTGEDSMLPRAIVVSGITEKQLHNLMALCRKSGMKNALWAVLTPASETWTMKQLLAELQAERKALSGS